MNWIIFAVLSAVFAALVAIFGKIGIGNVDSVLATSVRAVIMTTFLVVVSLLLKKHEIISQIDGKSLTLIALSGIAGAVSWLFYFLALKYGSASAVAAIDRTSVIFVIILSAMFLGEGLSLRSAAGAILVASGAILISYR